MTKLIKKKKPEEIDPASLVEPALTASEWNIYLRGVKLFNAGRFWDAHEVWEGLWRNYEPDSRIFFQGIIQAAAGCHLLVEKSRLNGAKRNFEKALDKLRLFSGIFLGLKVDELRESIGKAVKEIAKLENNEQLRFPSSLIPTMKIRRSSSEE